MSPLLLIMRLIAYILVCLALAGHGWHVQATVKPLQSSPQDQSHPTAAFRVLARLLLTLEPAAMFKPAVAGLQLAEHFHLPGHRPGGCLSSARLNAFSRASGVKALARKLPGDLGALRDSALPLTGKRVLVPFPRKEAAPFVSGLTEAGAQPIWCPIHRVERAPDTEQLEDAIMRITEYDVLIFLSPHSIDSMADSWLAIASGNMEIVRTMLDASGLDIAMIGTDLTHYNDRLGVGANPIAPLDRSVRGLFKTLRELKYLEKDTAVLVASYKISDTDEQPKCVRRMLGYLQKVGAKVDIVDTHSLVTSDPSDIAAEIGLLRNGYIDAICAGSAEELSALMRLAGLPAESDEETGVSSLQPVVMAFGEETRDAAKELLPSSEVLLATFRPDVEDVIAALEDHFGAGKLLI